MTQANDAKNITAQLSIQTLGGFSVSVSGRRIPDATWKLKKAKGVVKLLAISDGYQVHRDVVLDMLWPELDPDAATNNLHKTLYVARRAIEPGVSGSGSFIRFQGDTVGFNPDVEIDVDAVTFEELAANARSSGEPSDYRSALDLYQAELLPEDRYEEWSIARRDELDQTFQSLLSEFADIADSSGDPEQAIGILQRLVSVVPTLESAHFRLMKLYANSGNRHQAIKQYRSLAKSVESEFGLEPQEEVTDLYKEIVGGRTSFQPAPKSGEVRAPLSIDVGTFSSTGPPLVGRDAQLAQAEPLIAGLASGAGSVLLLSGPAGVGKSRLAMEIASRASLQGAHVMRGAAFEFERQIPYGPFSEALDSFVTALPDGQQRAIMDSVPSDIYPLLPQMTLKLGRAREIADSHDRAFLFSAVNTLLQSVTRTGPVVMVLDDIHAADESTLELFHYLARQTASLPLLLIATFRSEGEAVNSNFARVLAALNRSGIGVHLSLPSLDIGDVRRVISNVLDGEVEDDVSNAVFNKAEGNPLYVEETIRTMVEIGSIKLREGTWILASDVAEVPDAIRSLLNDRIERLAETSKRLLSVASVLGTETSYPLLRAAFGEDESTVLDAIDELLGRHLFIETDDGYRFSHGLHRDVTYDAMNRARRRKTHADVAAAILGTFPRQSEEHSESLAHHFLLADEQTKAVPYLIASGHRSATVFANEEALVAFNRAKEIIDSHLPTSDPTEFANLLVAIGDIHARIGDSKQSLELYKQGMEILEPLDHMAGFQVRGKAALAAINAEQIEEGEALLKSILANISPEMPDFAVSRTYLLLAQIGWHSSDHAGAIESAEKALKAALSSGDDTEAARAYEAMALSCHSLGDWQKGIEYELSRAEKVVPGFDTDTAFDAHL